MIFYAVPEVIDTFISPFFAWRRLKHMAQQTWTVGDSNNACHRNLRQKISEIMFFQKKIFDVLEPIMKVIGPWLWCSWQRSMVRIPTSAKFFECIYQCISVQCNSETIKKEKETRLKNQVTIVPLRVVFNLWFQLNTRVAFSIKSCLSLIQNVLILTIVAFLIIKVTNIYNVEKMSIHDGLSKAIILPQV